MAITAGAGSAAGGTTRLHMVSNADRAFDVRRNYTWTSRDQNIVLPPRWLSRLSCSAVMRLTTRKLGSILISVRYG